MPRHARLDAPGTLHHVIVRGIEKRHIVDDRKDRENFVTRLGEIAIDTETRIYAWALLTNHAHILLRSSSFGLSRYMRRLLTGYAISYNRRHRRHGHLFQNRYKSIVCEEETYFLELIRYIHLNPLRAGLVKSLAGLDRYRWSGHGVLMGRYTNDWQDRDSVLLRFGKKEKAARPVYRQFVADGVEQGRRPDLVGGGLVRSLGGWSEVKALRRLGLKEPSDDRILGRGEFVTRMVEEAENIRMRLTPRDTKNKIQEVIATTCKEEGISVKELKAGSRRRPVASARRRIARTLVDHGVTLAEAARQLGVSTAAISLTLSRKN
ncbi:MAG: transposase [Desulfobacterales bacterium]|nr:transposase [Desulfobacterales bacterium]